jgi:hypothetical protein
LGLALRKLTVPYIQLLNKTFARLNFPLKTGIFEIKFANQ